MADRDCWAPHMGAVSLTFDDGRPVQRQRAIPAMERYGLRGTFYINPRGEDWQARLDPWMEIARAGHEIGNHTLSHICSSNLTVRPGGLEDRSLDEIEADILAAQERLEEIAPHQKRWSFGYPCYQTFVGRGQGRLSYVPIVARHFICGRAGGEYGIANSPGFVDLACASGLATDRMSGYEMIGLAEALAAKGQWVILVFHDINGSRLTVGEYDFTLLLEYLHRRSDEVLTLPVAEAAARIADFQAGRSRGES
ncbi:MAG: polysaccharide deacetylase family protein [Acidobacteriota bacterium]